MSVATHEGSLLSVPGLSGFFTHTRGGNAGELTGNLDATAYKSMPSVVNYGSPMWNDPGTNSGLIIAQAVQTVNIVENVLTDPLTVIGHTGNAGYGKRAGTCEVTIDAILTSGLALGKSLSDFESEIPGNLSLRVTDGAVVGAKGKEAIASGLAINAITFTFTQNANSTLSVGLTGDGVNWFPLTCPEGMDTDVEHVPLTWDVVKLSCPVAGLIILSGVQTATFAATMTRNLVYEIGTFEPIEKPSQRPHSVTVTLNSLANNVVIQSWLDKFKSNFDPTNSANLVTVKVGKQGDTYADTAWITASGLVPSTATLNAAVGNNATLDLVFTGSSLTF